MKHTYPMLWKQEDGSALYLVLVIFMCIALLGSAAMAITSSQTQISFAHKRTANMYYLAQSGAEKMVDTMNKALYKDIAGLMKSSSEAVVTEVIDTPNLLSIDGNNFELNYVLSQRYEKKLKKEAYDTIKGYITPTSPVIKSPLKYTVRTDEGVVTIEVNVTHHDHSTDPSGEAGSFKIESKAEITFKNGAKYATKVSGVITLSDFINPTEIFWEEYEWAKASSTDSTVVVDDLFRTPILSFGDLVVTNGTLTVNGDVRVKGYMPTASKSESDEYGGIYVLNAGRLEIDGNAYCHSAIHTKQQYLSTGFLATGIPSIDITGDAIAHSITIEDDYYTGHPYNESGWSDAALASGKISIGGDVYTEDDLRVSRYVKKPTGDTSHLITVAGSFFGIMDEDLNTAATAATIDPNKSSAIYALADGDNLISLGNNVFVHGTPFFSEDNRINFHKLYESIGSPFEDLYSFSIDILNSDPIKEDYIKNIQEKNKINIQEALAALSNSIFGFSTRHVSANGNVYLGNLGTTITDPDDLFNGKSVQSLGGVADIADMKRLCRTGDIGLPTTGPSIVDINSKWNGSVDDMDRYGKGILIKELIARDWTTKTDESFPDFRSKWESFESPERFKGIDGYMFVKRGIFYSGTTSDNKVSESTFSGTGSHARMRPFADLPNLPVWNKDTPIHIMDEVAKTIDLKDYSVPTIIINKNANGVLKITDSRVLSSDFKGMIVSNSKIQFTGTNPIKVTGVVIARHQNHATPLSRRDLENGEYAGIHVEVDTTIQYDKDILFKVRSKDKGVYRKLLTLFKLADYTTITSTTKPKEDILLNKNKVTFSPSSSLIVTTDTNSGIRFQLNSLKEIE